MRRLAVAGAILATLLTTPLSLAAATPVPASPPSDLDRATSALQFLAVRQMTDGSLDHSIGETADFVIGAAAAGYDPSTLKDCSLTATALGYLANASDAAADDAAKTGKTVLAVVAAGGDPAAFTGRDLVARLGTLYHASNGAYGDGSTFSQALAVLGVTAAGRPVPAAAIAKLKSLADPDGSWSYGKAPVPAGQGDTNSTAVALMALDAADDHSADAAALAYLKSQQLPDGGFPYQLVSSFGPAVSDPDSDALVLQAIVAAGRDPGGSDWMQGAGSVLTNLASTQGANGGFAYPGKPADAFTTSQVPAALAGAPYAAAVYWTAGRSLPAIGCSGSSPGAGSTSAAAVSPSAPASPGAATTAEPVSSAPSGGSNGPSGLLIAAAAVLALIVLAGGGWAFMRRGKA